MMTAILHALFLAFLAFVCLSFLIASFETFWLEPRRQRRNPRPGYMPQDVRRRFVEGQRRRWRWQ